MPRLVLSNDNYYSSESVRLQKSITSIAQSVIVEISEKDYKEIKSGLPNHFLAENVGDNLEIKNLNL